MPAEGNGEFPTIIGADAKFKGELDFEKGVRVFGQFEGSIRTKGQLHVAQGSRVAADVTAGNIDVDGEVKGNLTASGKVHLKASARLEGDIKTSRLEVADGATFIGNCVVGPQEGSRPAVRPAGQEQPRPAAPAPQQAKKG
jgi:cytoskeletal protein CcmA (bactofilin family)